MVALPPVHVCEYDDGPPIFDNPFKPNVEKAYREAFYGGACDAARLPFDEFLETIDIAERDRAKTRERHEVHVPYYQYANLPDRTDLDSDWTMYLAGYEPDAARARGRHQALELAKQFTWEQPDEVPFEVIQAFILKPWASKLQTWAETNVDKLVYPDDPWDFCTKEQKAVLDCFKPIHNEISKEQPLYCLPQFRNVGDLLCQFRRLREPVIDRLLRRGETMNLISASKIGKSWLATDLALAIATGSDWLDIFPTVKGEVLIIDNELHPETSASRIQKVAEARGISTKKIADQVCVENMRGDLRTIPQLSTYFYGIDAGRFSVIILDAMYRLLPAETSENDNAAMAAIYNHLDRFATRLACSFVLIHHSSKGLQSGKAVTDVGAGAGSIARASDTHLILRPHEEPDVAVLEAAVRSWPPVEPICLRWNFPIWTPEYALDPSRLRLDYPRRRRKAAEKKEEQIEPEWTLEQFIEKFVTAEPKDGKAIIEQANEEGVSKRKAKEFLREGEMQGTVHRWKFGVNRTAKFATIPQSEDAS